jgi:hypothetical protein
MDKDTTKMIWCLLILTAIIAIIYYWYLKQKETEMHISFGSSDSRGISINGNQNKIWDSVDQRHFPLTQKHPSPFGRRSPWRSVEPEESQMSTEELEYIIGLDGFGASPGLIDNNRYYQIPTL